MVDDDILKDLNPQQLEAVTHTDGPLLVLAGAGTGKTRVITRRIAYLSRHRAPLDKVLAITFTNKAAGEMRERTETLCGQRSKWISTFHSLGARVLRRHIYRLEPYDTSFTICDRDDCLTLVKEILRRLDLDPKLWEPSQVLSEIGRAKNASDGGKEALGGMILHERTLREIADTYRGDLQERNLLDFDDLQLLLVRLFREHPDILEHYREQFAFVLVDEYQDTNPVQYAIARLLTQTSHNLCITGDPDQSIYRWRGADIRNILTFEQDYPDAHVVKLEQNYRSTAQILQAANALITWNSQRHEKELWSDKADGGPVLVERLECERSEAREVVLKVRTLLDQGTAPGDIAVFYRLNALSRPIEQEMIYANIPYSIVGGVEFFLRKEVKDLLAYLRIVDNPRDSESLRRIINVPTRGIGKSTVQALVECARKARKGLLEVVLREDLCPQLSKRPRQGLEAFRALHSALAANGPGVESRLRAVLASTEYEDHLRRTDREDAAERLANVSELVGMAVEFEASNPEGSLTQFLELAATLGDVDRWEHRTDRASLMTLHSAKGLEFPHVFIVGVEEGILPLVRAGDPDPDVEEERRLFYVGITRAMNGLTLTHTVSRMRFGQTRRAFPSRFLREIATPGTGALDSFARLSMDLATEESLHAKSGRGAWSHGARSEAGDDTAEAFFDADGATEGFDDQSFSQETGSEHEIETDPEDLTPGTPVWHDDYGEGTIVSTTVWGTRRRVTVSFPHAGEKHLFIGYTPLRRRK